METINLAIVGGGRGGSSLVNLFRDNRRAKINYIVDNNPDAPGLQLAREHGIRILSRIEELEGCTDLDLVINVTGHEELNEEIKKVVPDPSSVLNTELSEIIHKILVDSVSLNRELDQVRHYLENIVSNSRDMIITTDTGGNIVRFNQGGVMMLGFEESEVRGKPVSDFYYDVQDREKALEVMNRDGYISDFETRLKKKDGNLIHISLTLTPLYDSEGVYLGTVGVSKDITRRIRNEETIKEKNRQLQEMTDNLEELVAQRTAELERANARLIELNQYRSQFIANMSHELRTPLNSIIGFSEILIDGGFGELNDKQRKYAGNINRSGNHLLQIINDILDLSKIDAGKMELHPTVFDLNEHIKNSMFMLEGTAFKKGVDLSLQLNANSSMTEADSGRIKQVIYNLVSNAIKFTPAGGRVEIRTENQDRGIAVYVKDSGIGISEEDQKKIFNEFEQVDNSYSREYEGTGLGLPLVKRFLEMHNSDISVKSEVGKGSEFCFVLSATDRGDDRLEEPRETEKGISEIYSVTEAERDFQGVSDSPLILVVDDDPGSLELLTLTLTEQGYRTAHAKDGNEAIEKAHALVPAAITLDVMLPGMDGWEVIQRLKGNKKTAGIPIVMVTMTDNRSLAMGLGAVEFINKPIERNYFKVTIDNIIRRFYADKKSMSILAVDDREENLILVSDILTRLDGDYRIHLRTARSGMEAFRKIDEKKPDLLILDLMMPEVSGFQVIEKIKNDPNLSGIPIVILTAMTLSNEEEKFLQKETKKIIRKSEIDISDFLQEIKNVIGV